MDRTPRVTIGLPVYNAERYLAQSLDALLAQEFGDLEIVVSDNASTDGTWAICERYAALDSRIRLHRNTENLGAARNYNRTVELARGELFKWAAYDDICLPRLIGSCVAVLDASGPGTVLAYPQTLLIDEHDEPIRPYRDGMDLQSPHAYRRLATFARNWSLCNPAVGLIRTDVLRRTGRIRPYVSSDVALLAELATVGRFREVPERLFLRRIHAASSRQGTGDTASAAQWFAPQRSDAKLSGRTKVQLTRRVVSAISTADAPLPTRAGAAVTFATVWSLRKAHIKGSHLKHAWLDARAAAGRVADTTSSITSTSTLTTSSVRESQ